MNKTEHTCYCCHERSTETEHMELGLYQCIDIFKCMETAIAKGLMEVTSDDLPF